MSPSLRRRRVGALSDPHPRHIAVSQPERSSPVRGSMDLNQNPNLNPDPNGMDLISRLPDCLLSSILSRVPLRDAVRTSILSSRWRDLWMLNPLHLDDSSIRSGELNGYPVGHAVARLAAVHPGPIHSFCISQIQDFNKVNDLIETLTSKGIREFSVSFGQQGKLRCRIPPCLLQCKTLRKVSLSDCYFPPSPVLNSSFLNLKELSLEFVFLWDDLLHCLLKSCAQLEVLSLINCSGLQQVRVNGANLQKLTIHECCIESVDHVKKMVIENSPELRSLRLGERTATQARLSMQHVQNLEVLGFFSMDAVMRIGKTFTKSYDQYEMSVNKHMVLPTVKKLAILVGFANGIKCSLLLDVLRCFPCLETLYIKCIKSIGQPPETGFWEQQIPFVFFERHLKSVTMVNFFGLRAEVEFVKFLVQHGRVLERITIVCEHKLTTTWEKAKRRELRLRNRASMDLKVVFMRNSDFDPDSCEWAPLFYRPLPTY